MTYHNAGRRTHYYFTRYIEQLCNSPIARVSTFTVLPKRPFTTFENSTPAGKQTQPISTGDNAGHIKILLDTLVLRSREITIQASREINREQIRSSNSKTSSVKNDFPLPGIETHSIKNSVNAADALLSLTSNVLITHYFQNRHMNNLNRRGDDDNLHQAFLNVTTWICSILTSISEKDECISTETNLLLTKLLELTKRSSELLLLIPLSTYRGIAHRIAQYYHDDGNGSLGLVILGLYAQATKGTSISAQTTTTDSSACTESDPRTNFFYNPLIALIQRRKYLDAVRILEGMIQWNMSHLFETAFGLNLLFHIRETVAETVESELQEDAKNLKTLVDIIEKPLLQLVQKQKYHVHDFIESLGLVQIHDIIDDNEDDERGENLDDAHENDDDTVSTLIENMDDVWDTVEGLHSEDNLLSTDIKDFGISCVEGDEIIFKEDVDKLNALIASIQRREICDNEDIKQEAVQVAGSIISKVRYYRQWATELYSDSMSSADRLILGNGVRKNILDTIVHDDEPSDIISQLVSFREDILRESVYVRDQDMWDLPDVTTQLEAFSKNHILRFSLEYEDSLIREILLDELEKMTHSNSYDDEIEGNLDHPEDIDDEDDNDDDGHS